jgi:hypothetical protein
MEQDEMTVEDSVDIERLRRRARKQAASVREFMTFAGVYLAVGTFFFLINLFSGMDTVWFFWPLIPMTIPLVILAWRAFALQRFDDDWVERQVEKATVRSATPTPQAASRTELSGIEERASGLIDSMRRNARQIPTPAVRTRALDVCAAADRVLAAIGDNPEEVVLARDFVSRYLEPANTILGDYTRLATRNVASAGPTLRRVEEHDLPLLESKLNEVHDRLHRGSIIDLEVAREMLSLDVSDWATGDIDGEEAAAGERSREPRTS